MRFLCVWKAFSVFMPTFAAVKVRITAIKRELGENPRLSRSCEFL